MRVVITGGAGFIGTRLSSVLVGRKVDVDVLTRDGSRSRDHLHPKVNVFSWAPGADWERQIDGADAIVNLAGDRIDQRWTENAKRRIVTSRVESLERLFAAAEKAKEKPKALISASAIGIYGNRGDEELTEESPPGPDDDFLVSTCQAWEEAARRFSGLGVRVVTIRNGVVLSPEGGALARMLPAYRARMGAPLGSGKQYLSWIHLDDLAALYVRAIEDAGLSGVLNGTAPEPRPMDTFSDELRKSLDVASLPHVAEVLTTPLRAIPKLGEAVPDRVRVPPFVAKLLFGEMSRIVLEGQRVLPRRALESGFAFRFPELGPALENLLG